MNGSSVYLIPGLAAGSVELVAAELFRFRGELRSPLRTMAREFATRETILVRVEAEVGGLLTAGWGEAAPLEGWGADSIVAARRDLVRASERAFSGHTRDVLALLADMASPSARFALSTATLDAIGHARGRPLRHVFDADAPNRVPLNAAIGIAPTPDAVAAAERAWEAGFRTLKLKVGDPDDVERVRAVRTSLPDAALRLDANRAWTTRQARDRLAAFADLAIAFVEEPCEEFVELGDLPIRVAADESALPRASADHLIERAAIDVLVLKPALLGSVWEVVDLVQRAQEAGIEVVISSALDSAVGRQAAGQLAAALLSDDVACGLATDWFVRDVDPHQDRVRDGWLHLGSGNGLGLTPLADVLSGWTST